jgi:hypothetical protein
VIHLSACMSLASVRLDELRQTAKASESLAYLASQRSLADSFFMTAYLIR